jgi:hypothetical protein
MVLQLVEMVVCDIDTLQLGARVYTEHPSKGNGEKR